jgi:hypothetical protein
MVTEISSREVLCIETSSFHSFQDRTQAIPRLPQEQQKAATEQG